MSDKQVIRCFKIYPHTITSEKDFLQAYRAKDIHDALNSVCIGVDNLIWALQRIEPTQEDGAMRAIMLAEASVPLSQMLAKICSITADYEEVEQKEAA